MHLLIYAAKLLNKLQLGDKDAYSYRAGGSWGGLRCRLGLPTQDAYLEIFEGDTASVNAHLAVLAHIRGNLDARAEYIKRLPTDKLNEALEIIMRL